MSLDTIGNSFTDHDDDGDDDGYISLVIAITIVNTKLSICFYRFLLLHRHKVHSPNILFVKVMPTPFILVMRHSECYCYCYCCELQPTLQLLIHYCHLLIIMPHADMDDAKTDKYFVCTIVRNTNSSLICWFLPSFGSGFFIDTDWIMLKPTLNAIFRWEQYDLHMWYFLRSGNCLFSQQCI